MRPVNLIKNIVRGVPIKFTGATIAHPSGPLSSHKICTSVYFLVQRCSNNTCNQCCILHNINHHQNSTVTCIAKNFIHNSFTKYLQYMTIMIVLTIVICHDSRIVMSHEVTIAHLYCQ